MLGTEKLIAILGLFLVVGFRITCRIATDDQGWIKVVLDCGFSSDLIKKRKNERFISQCLVLNFST